MSCEPQAGLAEHATVTTAAIAILIARMVSRFGATRLARLPRIDSGGGYCDASMFWRRRHAVTRGAQMALPLLAALAGSAIAAPLGRLRSRPAFPVLPPPAWIEAGTAEKWLAYSTYCWKVACVDFISPEMRKDLHAEDQARPTRDGASRLRPVPAERDQGRTRRLVPRRTATWRPVAGVASIFAVRKAGGDASYAVRLKVR